VTNTQTKKINHYYLGMLAVLAMVAAMLLTVTPSYASTTFTVNSTADTQDLTPGLTGDVLTLRDAIARANANGNPAQVDRINFDIPGTGMHTISPSSPLPSITEPAIIDGYSQPGSSANTLAKGTNAKLLIQINGTDIGGTGLTVSASKSVIKGMVINRVFSDAIGVAPETAADVVTNVRIEGNFLGTDPSGTLDRGNGDNGVFLFAAANNTVGGTSLASRNLISGNGLEGVFIQGRTAIGAEPASDNLIRGTLIGMQRDGLGTLGNGSNGVRIIDSGNSTLGTHDANGNTVLSNSIFSSGGIGIDLFSGPDDLGPNANDAGDADAGPNRLQNKPVISSARTASGKTTIKGSLNSRPGATYTVQLFSNPKGAQGRMFIGQKAVTTDASGKASFTFTPAKAVAAGQKATATATNRSTGDTSEFSAAKGVVAG
jgi:hypothetical protein